MLEDIRKLVFKRLVSNREITAKWVEELGTRIRRKLHDNIKESGNCEMIWNGDSGFEVGYKGDTYVVDLEKKTCPCKKWELTGIPCPEAICAIQYLGHDPVDYVHVCYKKQTYLEAYGHMMKPMNGTKFWKKSNLDPPQPPKYKNMSGRPPKNRKKEEGENSSGYRLSRKGRIMTCQVYFQKGHNKKTCPLVKKSSNPGNSDQPNEIANETFCTPSNEPMSTPSTEPMSTPSNDPATGINSRIAKLQVLVYISIH